MADHAKFIGHLLDPSERKLVEQAREFSHDFDMLVFQAIDLSSMRPQSQTVPLLSQFVDENKVSVKSLRDFKKTARDLIEECRIKVLFILYWPIMYFVKPNASSLFSICSSDPYRVPG